jgi:heme-degrading monooxygenase HmoA
MICALTVRRLKPGSFDDFRAAFMADMDAGDPPPGWVRFDMVRNVDDPDEVVCFGMFDGTVEQLRADAPGDASYREQQERIAPYVESVGTDGFFEVVEEIAGVPLKA